MILTTHTFSSNSNTITFLYLIAFAQMQSSKEFVRPLQSRTPGKAYPAARLYILYKYAVFLENLQQNNMAPILARFFFKDTPKQASKPVQKLLLNFPIIFILFHSFSLFFTVLTLITKKFRVVKGREGSRRVVKGREGS